MFSKYSMIFFAPSILVWLLLFPKQRRWLWTPWPWLGGLVALAIFSPVLIWNAEHGWASVLYQSQRLVVHHLSWSYLAEYPLTQFGLLTPPIFILGFLAILRTFNAPAQELSARVLIAAIILPTACYFLWHSLHGRVEGNWPMPIFPAVSVAAAVAAEDIMWRGRLATLVFWSRRLAVPVAIAIAALIYVQALFGLLPFGHLDPTARALGVGWPQLAAQIDDIRRKTSAPVILTADYGVASWLSFYLPSSTPVEQVNNRMRWVNEPAPDLALFQGPMIFVCQGIQCNNHHWLKNRFRDVALISTIDRTRGGVPVTSYGIFRVASPTGPVLDPLDDGGSK
jgi:4-amino-4-deoxy-L-arabinose transferase-like glycosyltransferase